jgi:hypothetical protein
MVERSSHLDQPLQEKSFLALAPRAILIPSIRALQRTPEMKAAQTSE